MIYLFFYMVLFVIVCKTNYRVNVTVNQDRRTNSAYEAQKEN